MSARAGVVVSVRKFILVKAGGLEVRFERTHCYWCGHQEYICSACANCADRIRASLQRTAEKRQRRRAAIAKATGAA